MEDLVSHMDALRVAEVGDVDIPEVNLVRLIPSDAAPGAPPIEVSRSDIELSVTLKTILEDYDCDDDDEIPEIPLDNIDAETLKLVLIYCRRHRGEPAPTEDEIRDTRRDPIPEWDLEFITMPQAQLFRLFLASNFLDIKGLMELCAKHIASMIERNTTSQICETFNIPEDLTPEETKQLAKENEWLEA